MQTDRVDKNRTTLSGITPSKPAFELFCEKMDRFGAERVPFVFVVDYKCEKPEVWEISEVPDDIFYDFGRLAKTRNFPSDTSVAPVFKSVPVAFDQYLQAFSHAQKNIRRGESFLVNISSATSVSTNLSLDDIFARSTARYKFLYRDRFVCFSPETFVRIAGSEIATFPMKGTIDADLPDAEQLVLRNPKEAAEHATIVDLLRNDMSRVADKVWVEKYRYIDRIHTIGKTLLQVSSEIRGRLSSRYSGAYGSILAEMLPAGSISGAPKKRTLEIIDEAEGYDRGFYTGVMGYFDGEIFESAVMIRFLEQTSQGFVFKSGGGITAMSDARSEYQELIDKVYLPIPASPAGS